MVMEAVFCGITLGLGVTAVVAVLLDFLVTRKTAEELRATKEESRARKIEEEKSKLKLTQYDGLLIQKINQSEELEFDDTNKFKNSLTEQELLLLQNEISLRSGRKGVMYLLWFFLGLLGAHRIYLGDVVMGIFMAILSLTGIGLFLSVPWVLIDGLLIGERLEEKILDLETTIGKDLIARRQQKFVGIKLS